MDLTEFIATTTYFSFRGQLFKQKFGTAMGSPVSPILANFFMEWLEQQAIATAPIDCKPKLWKRYVDDILEIIKRGKVEALTDHLWVNGIDKTNCIKFTHKPEKNGQIPFLDTLITRREDGPIKLLVYRKATHTDQYLSFQSHHPLQHKLAVIRTLLERSDSIVTEEEDRKQEEEHIRTALHTCGYPDWAIKKVKRNMNTWKLSMDPVHDRRSMDPDHESGLWTRSKVQGPHPLVVSYRMMKTIRISEILLELKSQVKINHLDYGSWVFSLDRYIDDF